MNRLTEATVFSGFITACRLANCPTNRSPAAVIATTDGVSRLPSAFGMTVGSPPSITAITEFVVPRSIPIVRAIVVPSFASSQLGEETLRAFSVYCLLRLLAHLHEGGTDHVAVQGVAAAQFGDDRVPAVALDHHRLMKSGVEGLADRRDRLYALALEHGA